MLWEPCSTCSSPPGQAAARCATGDGRAATAAVPAPSAAAQLIGRAWPAADELLTWEQKGRLAGPGKGQLWGERTGACDGWIGTVSQFTDRKLRLSCEVTPPALQSARAGMEPAVPTSLPGPRT